MKPVVLVITSLVVGCGIFLFQQPALATVSWSQCRTEQGGTTIVAGATNQVVTLTRAISNTSKAFVLTQSTGDSAVAIARNHLVTGRVLSTTQLQFDRTGTAGIARVSYTLVECFNDEFTVQSGTITLTSPQVSNTAVLSTAVDTAKSLVLVSTRTSDNIAAGSETSGLATAALSDSTHVIAQRSGSSIAATTIAAYQVITFSSESGVNIQTNEVTLSPSTSNATSTLSSAIDPSRTWVYCSYDATQDGSNQTAVGCELSDSTTITVHRAVSGAYTNRIRYYAVTWPAGTVTVQAGSEANSPTAADGTQVDNNVTISAVSAITKAFSFVTTAVTDTTVAYPRNRWLNLLTSTTNLRTSFWRPDGAGNADVNTKYWQVIAFPQGHEAMGWGWIGASVDGTSGSGLISFNCENLTTYYSTACGDGTAGTRHDYAVVLEQGGCASDCDITGQAWIGAYDSTDSSIQPLGMIDFDPIITGSVTEPPNIAGNDPSTPNEDETKDAHWNEQTGELYGWARFRTLRDYESSLGGTSANDWGWIQLRGTPTSGSGKFGVLFDTVAQTFSGWAWNANGTDPASGTVVDGSGFGWVQFDLNNYGSSVADAWLKTTQGDIYSKGGINFSQAAPAGQYNATYLIQTDGSITAGTVSTSPIGNTNTTTNLGGVPTNNTYQVYRGALGSIHVNELITSAQANGTSQIGNCTDSLLSTHTNPLGGDVYYCSGNLTISNNLVFYNATANALGSGTVVVGGDLILNDNMSYYNDAIDQHINNLASVAWIVLGKVTINPSVSKLVGAYIVLGNTGSDFSTGTSTLPFTLNGLVMARSFSFGRTNIGSTASPSASETISYDGRVFANPPPGLENFTKVLPTIQ